MQRSTYICIIGALVILSGCTAPGTSTDSTLEVTEPYDEDISVTVSNDTVTIQGNLMAETPCHTVEASQSKSTTDMTIMIDTQSSDEICSQVVTERGYRYTTQLPEGVSEVIIEEGGTDPEVYREQL